MVCIRELALRAVALGRNAVRLEKTTSVEKLLDAKRGDREASHLSSDAVLGAVYLLSNNVL